MGASGKRFPNGGIGSPTGRKRTSKKKHRTSLTVPPAWATRHDSDQRVSYVSPTGQTETNFANAIGNSQKIAAQHDLQVTDDHYEKATQTVHHRPDCDGQPSQENPGNVQS